MGQNVKLRTTFTGMEERRCEEKTHEGEKANQGQSAVQGREWKGATIPVREKRKESY